ncbi:MAG TPA: hypothetical protein PLA74_07820, partial [Syntrophales bacterium]|nr:hypothetical protein [Syntrophales bacterium]
MLGPFIVTPSESVVSAQGATRGLRICNEKIKTQNPQWGYISPGMLKPPVIFAISSWAISCALRTP